MTGFFFIHVWYLNELPAQAATEDVLVAKKGLGRAGLWLRRHQARPRPCWHQYSPPAPIQHCCVLICIVIVTWTYVVRTWYRTRCPLCCFLDSHFVVSVTPFAVSVAHFVEMYSHFVDSVTHFVVSDQQNGNVYFQNVIRRPECWFSIWVESTILVLQKPRINNSCPIKPNQQIVQINLS